MYNPIIPLYQQINKLLVKSSGCFQYDSNGKAYLDFESGNWAANAGHSHPQIQKVLSNQSGQLIHDGLRFRNLPSEELAVRLMAKMNMVGGKSVFLNSGSEAVNLGITIARNLTKRTKIVKMDCSFVASYGFGHISDVNKELISIPFDNSDLLSEIDFREVAAFVFEPGSAWGLVKYPSNNFISAVVQKVKQCGGLLMANEVTTGFGRTGKWFGFQHYDYTPDIVSTGKALGNGYPISCVSVNKKTSDLFDSSPFRYAQSHQNDPLGCAVGLEVIAVFDGEDLVSQSFQKGEYFKKQLLKIQSTYPDKVKEIRARGLMLAMELHLDINAEKCYIQLINDGFLVGYKNNVLRFMPPLNIEGFHIDQLIKSLDTIILNAD